MYLGLLQLTVLLPGAALALPTSLRQHYARDTTPITDGNQVGGKTYDYIIAGGGLGGMVLAKRLTEDVSKSVLVIEAGKSEENNDAVTNAGNYQQAFDTDVDWAYQTVSQQYGGPKTMRSGKGLGGSTLINGMAWSKPHTFQIDALETVGNNGLNWNSLQPYMLKVENFHAPSSSQSSAGITSRPSCHANGGPLQIQFDPNANPQQFEHNFNTSVQNKGLPYAFDLTCGNPAGEAPIANTRDGSTRSDAFRAYVYQQSIPNLTILTGATVGKVTLSSGSTPNATGVEFRDSSGNTYNAKANLEVIMATGSIRTPLVLQQSGIGPSNILSQAGVDQVVNLPVGLNLIDQTTSTSNWNINGAGGGGQPITFPRFEDLFTGSETSEMQNLLSDSSLQSYVQSAVNANAYDSASSSGLLKVLQIQANWILKQGAGISESFDYTYGTTLGYDSWYLLPFGRGSIKIDNNQPYSNSYSIDPRYFSTTVDKMAQAATVRFTRQVSGTSPLSDSVTGERDPGTGSVPQDANLDSWANWVENNYRSNWHPIGTAAMMSKDMGGVVDSNHKVYGVNNLRVVDGSVLPFQVSSHLMSVLYGLSERAAEIIKNAHPPSNGTGNPGNPGGGNGTKTIRPKNFNNKCLQVQGSASNGAAVAINDCNGSQAQQWKITSGGAIQTPDGKFCLDAGDAPVENGTKMKIWQCYDTIPAQTWQIQSSGQIKLKSSNECIDLPDGSSANGNVVQVWQCFDDNNNQRWTEQ